MRIYLGVPWRGGLKRPWGGQNQRVLAISVAISLEPLELKWILLCGVMKYLVGFPVTLKWITLRCHFMLDSVFIVGFTRFFCLAFEDNYVKMNEDTSILSATRMFARDCSSWWYKVYGDIHYGSCLRRCQLTVVGRKRPIFNAISCLVLQTFKN